MSMTIKANESMLIELTTGLDAFRTFVKNTLDNPNPEPFCPFTFSGYCNDAYSNRCYQCEYAVKDYLRMEKIK